MDLVANRLRGGAQPTLASDSVEIEHITDQDGTARSTLGWQAVVPDA